MGSLSVCIVTLNEAKNIERCLKSVSFADEIIIVDAGSTDETLTIARQFTDKIIVNPWPGCGPQKHKACSLATKEWILILDADEEVSQELKLSIQKILTSDSKHAAYNIAFQTYYCGKYLKFGDWIKEKHLRLFKKNTATIIPRIVHFRVEINGSIGFLREKILHYPFNNLENVIAKMNEYSSYEALHKWQSGKKASILEAVGRALFTFIRGYILKFGFLDGKEGLMLAISNAEGTYYRYAKLMLLTTTQNKPDTQATAQATNQWRLVDRK